MRKTLHLLALISIVNVNAAFAAPVIEGPQNFRVVEVSNSGLVAGNRSLDGTGKAAVWNPANNIVDVLPMPADGILTTAHDINTAGQICGQAKFSTSVYPKVKYRAMLWTGPGATPQDLGASTSPDNDGESNCAAINNLGVPAGDGTHCRAGETWYSPYAECDSFPMYGTPFALLGAEPVGDNRYSYAVDINDSGQAIGLFWNPANDTLGQRILQNGSALTDVGFNVEKIMNNGTVYGYLNSNVRMRSPLGTESIIPCGSYFLDANEYGDVLTYTAGSDVIRVWHDNKCELLSAVLPEGSPAYKFPSQTAAGAFINDHRQIAANVTKPSVPASNINDYFTIFFTPKYVTDPLPTPEPTAPSGSTPVATAVATPDAPLNPAAELTSRINNISALLKKIKATFPKTKKAEQAEIKTALKSGAADLLNYATANKANIATSSSKVDLAKLAKALKAAIGKVIQRKDTFNDDKKAANKSITNLKKGIA